MAVPTFSITAHMVSVNGAAPSGSFTFFLTGAGSDIPSSAPPGFPSATVSGSASSGALHMGAAQLERGQSPLGLRDYPPNQNGGIYSNTTTVDASFASGMLAILGPLADPSVVSITFHVDDATAADYTLTEEVFAGRIQFVVYRDSGGVARVQLATDYNQRFWDVINTFPAATRPSKFRLVLGTNVYDDTNRGWQKQVQAMVRLGITNMGFRGDRLTASLRTRWQRDGIDKIAIGVYNVPGAWSDWDTAQAGDSYETPDTAGVNAWATRLAGYVTAAGWSVLDCQDMGIADEPYFPHPAQLAKTQNSNDGSNPALPNGVLARQEFTAYLQAMGVPPAEVGVANYASPVTTLGRSAQSSATVTQRARFYWTMRWLAANASDHYARCTAALEAHFDAANPARTPPGFGTHANWNNTSGRLFEPNKASDDSSPDRGAGNFDWLDYGRRRGATKLWTEDWFYDNRNWQWSNMASRLRCGARKGGVGMGGYNVAASSGGRADGMMKRLMTLVGHGANTLWPYTLLSPEYNMNAEGALQLTLTAPGVFSGVGDVASTLAACEDLLYPGVVAPSSVAILHPRSAQMWDVDPNRWMLDAGNQSTDGDTVDYMGDAFGIYLALQHANIATDWVDEDDLLSLPPVVRLLYVTTPNLSPAAQAALQAWVNGGGTLVTTLGAGTFDHYNTANAVVGALAGAQTYPGRLYYISSSLGTGAGGLPADNTVTFAGDPGGQHFCRGPVGAISPASGATTLATFAASPYATGGQQATGTPAMVERVVGSGRVRHFPWFPGLSYHTSQAPFDANPPPSPTPLPTGFDASLRSLIVAPVANLGILNPFEVGQVMVETPVRQSAAGWAVTMLNWTDTTVGSLSCRVRCPFVPTRIHSRKQGADLAFTATSDGYTFSVPLGSYDVIRVFAPAATPPPASESWGVLPL